MPQMMAIKNHFSEKIENWWTLTYNDFYSIFAQSIPFGKPLHWKIETLTERSAKKSSSGEGNTVVVGAFAYFLGTLKYPSKSEFSSMVTSNNFGDPTVIRRWYVGDLTTKYRSISKPRLSLEDRRVFTQSYTYSHTFRLSHNLKSHTRAVDCKEYTLKLSGRKVKLHFNVAGLCFGNSMRIYFGKSSSIYLQEAHRLAYIWEWGGVTNLHILSPYKVVSKKEAPAARKCFMLLLSQKTFCDRSRGLFSSKRSSATNGHPMGRQWRSNWLF